MSGIARLTTCLWFDGDAEEAATFYVGLFPDARIDSVNRSPADYPAGKAGAVLSVQFTLFGQAFMGLNGGSGAPFSQAISFQIPTRDQAETDRYWTALIANGGEPNRCSWLQDRFGVSWQVVPQALSAAMAHPDRAAAKRAMQAMMTMGKIDIAAIERAVAGEV